MTRWDGSLTDVEATGARRSAHISEPDLVGRKRQLATVALHVEDAAAGSGRVVIVHGPSGSGKSRLLDEAARRAAVSGAWVLRGQAVDRAQARPFQILDGVLSAITARAKDDPGYAESLQATMSSDLRLLRDLVPGLTGHTLSEPHARTAQPGQSQVVSALLRLVESLGTAGAPAVAVLDDFQWADELSTQLVTRWADSGPPGGGRFVLLVLGVRTDAGGPPQMTRPGAVVELEVPPLTPVEVRTVAESMTGALPADAVGVVVELAGGSPFMVSAVVRGLHESGALDVRSDGAWVYSPRQGGLQTSDEAASVLARRLDMLPGPTRALLSAGAVLGREFDQQIAAAICGDHPGSEPMAAAVDRNLVWPLGPAQYRFVHDRIREALLASLSPAELAATHRSAARLLADRHPERSFEIAYHFDAAGDPAAALEFACQSAERARARHDFDLAEAHYAIAERGALLDGPDRRLAVAEAFGELLMLRGRHRSALERFRTARELAATDLARARIEGKLGELAFRHDEVAAAVGHLEDALRLLGESVPQRPVALCSSVGVEIGKRWASPLRRRRADRSAGDVEARELVARLYNRLCYAQWYHCGQLTRIWMMLRSINAAQSCPPGRERAHAYSTYGGGLAAAYPILWRRGLTWARRGQQLHRTQHDRWGEAQALSMQGVVLHAAARYRDAERCCEQSRRLLADVGDRWERHNAAIHQLSAQYRLGNIDTVLTSASQTYLEAAEVGDVNAQSTALGVWAKAADGRIPRQPITQTQELVTGDLQARVALLEADALALRAMGQLDEAIRTLESARGIIRRASMRNVYVVSTMTWLATLYRERAAEGGMADRQAAVRAARRALWDGLRYPTELPHALRESGSTAALSGRRRRAKLWLRLSRSVATRQQAVAELALTGEALSTIDAHSERRTVTAPAPAQLSRMMDGTSRLLGAADILPALESSVVELLGRGTCRTLPEPGESTGDLSLRVPILVEGAPYAELVVTLSPTEAPLDTEEGRAVLQLCELAGTVLENRSLHRERKQELTAAREAERARLARDLHDELGQSLTSLLLGIRLAENSLQDSPPDRDALRWQFSKLRGMAGEAMEQVQRFAFELRPSVLDDRGLVPALETLTARMAALMDLDITFAGGELRLANRLPAEVETAVYRIVQEALTNISRHACATTVTIVLATVDNRLRLVIDDDGVGLDDRPTGSGGHGMTGMAERARLLGGSLHIESQAGQGTTLVLEIPLE